MRLKIDSQQLIPILGQLQKAVPSKTLAPIHGCFHITATESGDVIIKVSTPDYTVQTMTHSDEVTDGGVICVEARRFAQLMKTLSGEIELSTEASMLTVRTGTGEYMLPCVDADAFAEYVVTGEQTEFIVPADVMLSGLSKSLTAIVHDELRPVMNGVFWDVKQESIVFVGSDGHKLIRHTTPLHTGVDRSFIMPGSIASMARTFFAKDADVRVSVSDNSAVMDSGSVRMSFRQIEGRYPNYNSVIPPSHPYTLTVNKSELADILNRVKVVGNTKSGLVKLSIISDSLVVNVVDEDFSTSAKEVMSCESNTNMCIGFNGDALSVLLSNIDSEKAVFHLSSPSHSATITPYVQDDSDLVELIMPMLLS